MEQVIAGCEDLLQSTGIDGFLQRVGLTARLVAQGLFFFGAAFLIGFFFKKYIKILLGGFLIAGLLYTLLQYNNLIVVDWTTIAHELGITTIPCDFNGFIAWGIESLKCHLFVASLAMLGFIFGYKWG